MIEILSLPRRPKEIVTVGRSTSTARSGLPINSLPGWEHIPLNSKLPMLKCPGNQVVFSKNKIGKSIQDNRESSQLKNQFDPSGRDSYPEYNALHDSNLRTFYANERNLKRLRTNGEITQQNDVICNLKDFNEYRQQLHKSQLHFILQKMNQLEEEQHDRMLITNAENIAARDQRKQSGRGQSYNQVRLRKTLQDQKKFEKFQKSWETKQQKFASIQMGHAQFLAVIRQQKVQRQLEMQKHWDLRNDLQRKKLISLKKQFHLKSDRMQKNMLRLCERRANKDKVKQIKSWKKRLDERISHQERMQSILRRFDYQRRAFISNHIASYKEKWQQIDREIKERSSRMQRRLKSWQNPNHKKPPNTSAAPPKDRRSFCTEFQGSFDNLLDEEVCKALNTALDLQDNINVPFDAGDPIYKAAQFIMQHILTEFHKDLTCDQVAYSSVYKRVDNFFEEAKKFVIFRATQIISAARNSLKEIKGEQNSTNGNNQRLAIRHGSIGRVSFSTMSRTIGTSSYEIHPHIEVRDVGDRRPTPAGSLDSIVLDSTTSLAQKTPSSTLCRNELVFIEHYVTKFKRELLVGVGKRVFAAIECHFHHKIMDVRQELLELDRKFLVNQVTKSILGYGINPLNFDSILRLSISALASDITWSLQQVLLKPARDPRRIAKPNVRRNCLSGAKGMCPYCRSH